MDPGGKTAKSHKRVRKSPWGSDNVYNLCCNPNRLLRCPKKSSQLDALFFLILTWGDIRIITICDEFEFAERKKYIKIVFQFSSSFLFCSIQSSVFDSVWSFFQNKLNILRKQRDKLFKASGLGCKWKIKRKKVLILSRTIISTVLSANHLNAIFFKNEILVQLDSKRQAAHADSGSFGLRGLVFEIWISVYHPKWLIHMYENNYRQTTQMQDATFFSRGHP